MLNLRYVPISAFTGRPRFDSRETEHWYDMSLPDTSQHHGTSVSMHLCRAVLKPWVPANTNVRTKGSSPAGQLKAAALTAKLCLVALLEGARLLFTDRKTSDVIQSPKQWKKRSDGESVPVAQRQQQQQQAPQASKSNHISTCCFLRQMQLPVKQGL